MENRAIVSDRLEFQRAREEAGMTGWDVDERSRWSRGTCRLFELKDQTLTPADDQKLIEYLQIIVEYECTKRDYAAAILAYMAKHERTLTEVAGYCGVPESVLRNIMSARIKTHMRAKTCKKLDALLFAD